MLKHYVEFFYPGVFVAETSDRQIKKRDAKSIKRPDDKPYAFRFFSREEKKSNGEILSGKNKDYSGMYYFAGEVYTIEQLKCEFSKESILIRNVEANGYKAAIFTDCGNWQPIEKNTIVLKELPHGTVNKIRASLKERTTK